MNLYFPDTPCSIGYEWMNAALVDWYWQGKSDYSDKNLSQCHFVHHKYKHRLVFMLTGRWLIVRAKIWHHTFLKHLIHIQPCQCYVQEVSASKTHADCVNSISSSASGNIYLLDKSPSSLCLLLCVTSHAATCYQRHGRHFAVHNKSI
jgi:hypothetical protein